MKNLIHAFLAVVCAFAAPSETLAQDAPLPPRVAPMKMTLPEGFKATLFAGEPDVVQPIAMCFDARGRLWVAECMSYPNWEKDPKKPGKDRILIFEDTDNDGTFDKRTVFADNLANVSALQVGFGGVFVGATPYLLFIPDKNGDDIPDGPPEIVVDGFDVKTGHNAMSSLTWGPDGWLYGTHGIQAVLRLGKPGTPADKRAVMDCGVWRYHPVRKEVEAFAHGTTNPWGLDFDECGQMFITNCVIGHLWHVVPGAHFERMYGQDLNPNVYGLMKMCADHIHWGGGSWTTSRGNKLGVNAEHSEAGGGHAHVGCMVYLGDNFPDRYRNTVFMCNLHGNRINNDILERKGSTYIARHGKDFMFANDPWFRGIALCYGPDGGVYVSDWTDTGECHNYKVVDQTNGRIYKITYGTAKNPAEWLGKGWDLSKMADEKLIELLTHKNEWFGRTARRVLQERAAESKLAKNTRQMLESLAAGGKLITVEGNLKRIDGTDLKAKVPPDLRGLWALHVTGGVNAKISTAIMKGEVAEETRAWVVRLAAERPSTQQEDWLYSFMSGTDGLSGRTTIASAMVRLELASALQRLSYSDRLWLAFTLVSHAEDAEDPYLPLMLWYGVESMVINRDNLSKWNELPARGPFVSLALLSESKIPLIREHIARRISTLGEHNAQWQDLFETLHGSPAFVQRDILRGMQEGLKGRRQVPMPKVWEKAFPDLVASPLSEVRDRGINLAVQFGDQRAFATLGKIVADNKEPATKRQSALSTLLFQQKTDLVPVLQDLLSDTAMRPAAIKGLARFDDPKTPILILKQYGSLNEEEKADAVHTLTSRAAYAKALLKAMEIEMVPIRDVSAFNARQIQALGDPKLTDALAKVWGAIRPASEEKAKLMAKYKSAMTKDNLKKGNLSRGRLLYEKTCASCHRLFGEGGDIGPDLTGSQRMNLDYLLENMLDPSAIVAKDYQVTVLATTGGRVITGIIKQENDKALTVQTQNELIVLPKEDIESRKRSEQSMMPEGQLDTMTMNDVRDLIAYLASPMQVERMGGGKK